MTGHGEQLHLMAGTVDTSGSGGADRLADAAVVDFAAPVAAPAGFDDLLAHLVPDADGGGGEPFWEQTALFDPVTLQVALGAQAPPPVPKADPAPPPVPAATGAPKRQHRATRTGTKK